MPRVNFAVSEPVFKLYNPKDRWRARPGFTWRYLLRTAVNISSAVEAIHAKGYVVGDLNESNLMVAETALVTLVDCDSMQVPQPGGNGFFRCPVGKPEYTPPELQGRDFSATDRNAVHDNFGLAVLIFHLLMEGIHPFAGVTQGLDMSLEERIKRGESPYSGSRLVKPMPIAPPFEILPREVQALFLRCFHDGHSESAGASGRTRVADCVSGGRAGSGRLPIQCAARVQWALRHVSMSMVPADCPIRRHRPVPSTRAADGSARGSTTAAVVPFGGESSLRVQHCDLIAAPAIEFRHTSGNRNRH